MLDWREAMSTVNTPAVSKGTKNIGFVIVLVFSE